ncbi:MAG: hypothetical protein JWO30_1866 [Fibrobacteres bacterium]|nr:hypothetical protein [Fibrobacterota bacterium]
MAYPKNHADPEIIMKMEGSPLVYTGSESKRESTLIESLAKATRYLILFTAILHASPFQSGVNDAGTAGNSGYRQAPGSSAIRTKTISNSFYRPYGGSGTVLHSVNLMTGQPFYQVPLTEISAGDGIVFPIALTYSGSIRQTYDADNGMGPTSWIGYGWDFQAPFIAVNHKGTVDNSDDLYYCDLGQYGSGQLLQNSSGAYFLSTDPTLIITPTLGSGGLITQWTFETMTGVRLIFGSSVADDNASRILNRVGGWITGSPYSTSVSQSFTYRWDISRMEEYGKVSPGNPPVSNNALVFKYAPINTQLGNGKYFTRESYLSEVIHKDRFGNEIEKFKFITDVKEAEEYATKSSDPFFSQDLYETRRLTRIERYLEGSSTEDRAYILESHSQDATGPDFPYTKRLLDYVHFETPNPRGGVTLQDKMSWHFEYDLNSHRHFGLTTIEKPGSGKDEYAYGRPDYRVPDWTARTQQDPNYHTLKRPDGSDVLISSIPETGTAIWKNQSSCSERYCIVAASMAKHLYFEVWKNNGNYFSLAKDEAGIDLRGDLTSTKENSLHILPWNDNFMVVDVIGKTITLYEWTGKAFRRHTDIIKRKNADQSRTPIAMVGDSIGVFLGNDYFLVREYNYNNHHSDDVPYPGTRFFVISKDGDDWKDINEGTDLTPTQCGLGAPPYGYDGYTEHSIYDKCLEFSSSNSFSVSVSPNMFILVDHANSAILPYVRAETGNSFIGISDRFLNFGEGIQDPTRLFQWGPPVFPSSSPSIVITDPITIGEDYFAVRSGPYDALNFPPFHTRIDIFHYDGSHIQRVGGEPVPPLVRTAIKIWGSKDYLLSLGRDAGGMYVNFWRKTRTVGADGNPAITFVKQRALSGVVVDPASPDLPDVRIIMQPTAFSVEFYPKKAFDNTDPVPPPPPANPSYPIREPPTSREINIPFAPPLLQAGNYQSYLFKVDPASPASATNPVEVPSEQYEDQNHKKLFNFTFSTTDNLITGMSCQNSAGGVCTDNADVRIDFFTGMTAPLSPAGSTPFVRNLKPVFSPWDPLHASYRVGQYNLSDAARIGAATMINKDPASGKIEFSLLQSMGQGFTQYPFDISLPLASDPSTFVRQGDLNFVKSFTTRSNITGGDGDKPTQFDFFYLQNGLFSFNDKSPEYNAHLQSFVFPTTSVLAYRNNSPIAEGAETVHHIADEETDPIPEEFLVKTGLPIKTEIHDIEAHSGVMTPGRLMSKIEREYYEPQRDPSWPDNEFVVRLKKKTLTTVANNGSSKQVSETFHNYLPACNRPTFVKSQLDGDWILTQSLYPNSGVNRGVPFAEATFRFANEPTDASLASWSNPDMPYSDNGALLKAISAKEIDFDPLYPFKIFKTKIWRDRDPTLTNDELKLGTNPIHSLSNGTSLEVRESVEKRDEYGSPTEIRQILDEAETLEKRKALFYEGLASKPVAVVDNTYNEDAAVLTGENAGVAGLQSYDSEGRWPLQPDIFTLGIRTGGITYATDHAHSGRYGLAVTNIAGLSTDLMLKGVAAQGYDYVISAWMYVKDPVSPLSLQPTLTVERHSANGAIVEALPPLHDPIGQPFHYGQWQRYEFKLTNSDIRGPHNLFASAGSGDFLRVRIGAEDNFFLQFWRTVYVDDVVCRPSKSIATLQTYDTRGNPSSLTNNDQIMTTFEYDIFGNLAGIRDDKDLMFKMTSKHLPGEND